MLYFDYMASTPVDPEVLVAMQNCMGQRGYFANPASQHRLGLAAREQVLLAKQQVAQSIHADPSEIIWTSGATESINLALKGVMQFYARQGKHLITASTEHKATLEVCRYLASHGFSVTYLSPAANGVLDVQQIAAAIRPDTILCSLMHVNNETGVIQDITAIGTVLREKGVWFHVDAAQSVGKLAINMRSLPVDLVSLSAHKVYGPKGIGALYVRGRPKVQLIPQIHGGDADNFLRAGTLPTHQIVGMGCAYQLAEKYRATEVARITALRAQLWERLSSLPGFHLNNAAQHCIPHCLNIRVDQSMADKLFALTELAISSGSACNAADPEPSHVLTAMGLAREAANRSFRISLGRYTTSAEIDAVSNFLARVAD